MLKVLVASLTEGQLVLNLDLFWKLQGFVISDWEGLDSLSDPYGSNYRECVLSSVSAGIDMVISTFLKP